MYIVKTRFTFCCALRLYQPQLTDAENFALYGPCSTPAGHGHNYDVEVAVAGTLDPQTSMVVNFDTLDRLVKSELFRAVDHKNLNVEVPFLSGLVPTTEVLCMKFWEILEPKIQHAQLYSITIGERDNNIVTYYGPSATWADLPRGVVSQ